MFPSMFADLPSPSFPRPLLALVAAAALAGPALAADEVPPTIQASIFLKVLSYDRNLSTRANGPVRLALVYRNGDAAGEALSAALGTAFDDGKVPGVKVKTLALAFTTVAKLEADLIREKVTVAYLCDGMSDEVPAIVKVTQARSISTLGSAESYVKQGVSVAVARRGSRPAIVINLKASRAEGADLDSTVLRLAEIVE